MILNYLKTLLHTLKRQKGFMILNLIVLTASMLVIMVMVSIISLIMKPDFLQDSEDTHYNIREQQGNYYRSNLNEEHYKTISKAFHENDIFLISIDYSYSAVIHNSHKGLSYNYVNENFSNNYNLTFIEGQNFQPKHFNSKQRVVVISKTLSHLMFGENKAIGETFVIHQNRYKIVGIYKNRIKTSDSGNDFYLPLTTHRAPEHAGLTVFIRSKNAEAQTTIESQLNKHSPEIQYKATSLKQLKTESMGEMIIPALIVIILSLLLPALLLSNLTLHRMESRLEELAVRKAFGAAKRAVYRQLIIENVIFTFIAAGFALLIGQYVVSIMYYGLSDNFLSFDLPISLFVVVLLVFLLFAVVTGVIPARKVARQSIIQSLNSK